MKREPTQEEREKMVRAVAGGDRIRATSMYISITECGLTEAQKFIKTLTTELQAESPERFVQKPHTPWQSFALPERPYPRESPPP
jgi:ribosomal protein L7/L12